MALYRPNDTDNLLIKVDKLSVFNLVWYIHRGLIHWAAKVVFICIRARLSLLSESQLSTNSKEWKHNLFKCKNTVIFQFGDMIHKITTGRKADKGCFTQMLFGQVSSCTDRYQLPIYVSPPCHFNTIPHQ